MQLAAVSCHQLKSLHKQVNVLICLPSIIYSRKMATKGEAGPLPVGAPVSADKSFESARGPSLSVVSEDDSQAGSSV